MSMRSTVADVTNSWRSLLPEEDAIDDPDEDDEADPTVPGDLWFRLVPA